MDLTAWDSGYHGNSRECHLFVLNKSQVKMSVKVCVDDLLVVMMVWFQEMISRLKCESGNVQ